LPNRARRSLKPLIGGMIALLLCGGCTSLRLESGSTEAFRTAKTFNIQFDYSDMRVHEGISDAEYVAKKAARLNAEQAGRGDRWKEGWIGDRASLFQPKFEDEVRRALARKRLDVQVGSHPDAKYTIVVKTTYCAVWHKVGKLELEVLVCETGDRAKPLAVMSVKETYHDAWGNLHNDAYRLQTTYGMAGKDFGNYFARNFR
jgi:hypothetical protein